ncbi:MAG: trigger factor [Thermaerobacter sp.]|nr:trigger factor [Thermaerobacter sp.]
MQGQEQEQDQGQELLSLAVQVDRLPKAMVRLTVTVPAAEMGPAMGQAFRKLVARYNIPGFRRGKAPRHVFERYVGTGPLVEEAARILIDKFYPQALEQADVVPAQEPRLQITEVGVDEPLVFTAEMGVMPTVELGNYRQWLDVPPEVPTVTEELLEEERRQVATRHAEWVVAGEEDPIESGSRVVVNLSGRVDLEGETEPFVEADDHVIEVGQGATLEPLEAQLIGGHVGEDLTVRFNYPPDYPDASLAGQPAIFQVKVNEHKRRVVPAFDEELARAEGLDTLDELEEKVQQAVATRLEQESKQQRMAELLGKLKESAPFEIPEALTQHELVHRVSDMQRTLEQLGADLDQYLRARALTLPALLEELRPAAEDRIRDDVLLHALAKAEGLTVTDEELQAYVAQQVADDPKQVAEALAAMKKSGDVAAARESLLMEKVVRLVSGPASA